VLTTSDVQSGSGYSKEAVDSTGTKSARCLIRFTDFGDSSLNFSIIFGQKNYSELKISKVIFESKYLNYLKKTALLFPFLRVVHLNK
jgi:hypothetical protein